jgi:hypothetical protein
MNAQDTPGEARAELAAVRSAWQSLRKSAVSFAADLASTERPDQVLARANAFLARLEDTARRAEAFHTLLQRLLAMDATRWAEDREACATAAAELAEGALEILDDEVLAVVGRQTAPRIAHYNQCVSAMEAARVAFVEALQVGAGVLSVRHMRHARP